MAGEYKTESFSWIIHHKNSHKSERNMQKFLEYSFEEKMT